MYCTSIVYFLIENLLINETLLINKLMVKFNVAQQIRKHSFLV